MRHCPEMGSNRELPLSFEELINHVFPGPYRFTLNYSISVETS